MGASPAPGVQETAAQPDPVEGSEATLARSGGPDVLAQALQDSRRDTLATFAAYERAYPALRSISG